MAEYKSIITKKYFHVISSERKALADRPCLSYKTLFTFFCREIFIRIPEWIYINTLFECSANMFK